MRIDITTKYEIGAEVIATQNDRAYHGRITDIEVSVHSFGRWDEREFKPLLQYTVRPYNSRRSRYVGEDDLRHA
jgi:hypothetical protein